MSSCGSVTYGVAKELAKILKPLVGKSPHHINSTQDFVEQAKHFKLESGECLSSYDVSSLFTSVPIDPVLTADKGVAMVVMDRQDYINKANHLLNQSTYKVITKDPTNTIKNKLINILKGIKTKTGLGINTYKSMYPTGCVRPKFYGLPKIHKPDTPLRPIVSSCGSVTYGVAKELAKILKPLVGKSPHHINSTQDFVEQAKHFKLESGECLSSYDVSSLFTSVPIDPVLAADKGVAMVVMDRQDYINKANHLLNQSTYKVITKDPTNTIKNKLINILKGIKTKTGLGINTYKSMYPTGCVRPKFYGLPKIHKPDTPLRPIVSSCGSVTYGVAKELAKILKPLVGKSPHHINSTQDFVEQAKHFKLESGECLSSYDVSSLFTSVPIDPVLTADKGVAMVVMDRQDYINKANHLLNQSTYKVITKDPTNTIKNKLINILKGIKTKTGLGINTYKSMYPTGCVRPKFYGLPKIHKPDTPLRPIVSSCGSVTYGVAKELAKILKPLVGKSPHHINSTQDFVEQAKHFKLESGECLSSYDVSSLFTSVPIDPVLAADKGVAMVVWIDRITLTKLTIYLTKVPIKLSLRTPPTTLKTNLSIFLKV